MPDNSRTDALVTLGPRWLVAAGIFFGLGAIAALAFAKQGPNWPAARSADAPRWMEVAWPFATDEWGRGKAFHCAASECGADIALYLRPKIGFCNCTTGVADDDELDRVSDFSLMGADIAPIGGGNPIQVGSMQGRSRTYRSAANGHRNASFSVAFSRNCDVIVATAIVAGEHTGTTQPMTLRFLGSDRMVGWAKHELGL